MGPECCLRIRVVILGQRDSRAARFHPQLPTLDPLEAWSSSDRIRFVDGMRKCGKQVRACPTGLSRTEWGSPSSFEGYDAPSEPGPAPNLLSFIGVPLLTSLALTLNDLSSCRRSLVLEAQA